MNVMKLIIGPVAFVAALTYPSNREERFVIEPGKVYRIGLHVEPAILTRRSLNKCHH
jgi:hypothetical protein